METYVIRLRTDGITIKIRGSDFIIESDWLWIYRWVKEEGSEEQEEQVVAGIPVQEVVYFMMEI